MSVRELYYFSIYPQLLQRNLQKRSKLSSSIPKVTIEYEEINHRLPSTVFRCRSLGKCLSFPDLSLDVLIRVFAMSYSDAIIDGGCPKSQK